MKKLLFILFFFALSFTGFAQHQYTSYVTASGTNTYAVTVSVPTITNYSTKRIHLRFANANSGASTLNVTPVGASPLGAVAIRAWDGDSWEALTGGEIVTGVDYVVVYNGTYFELYASLPGSGGGAASDYVIETITGTGPQTITDADNGKIFIYTNASGCAVLLGDGVTEGKSFTAIRAAGAGDIEFQADGTASLHTVNDEFIIETDEGWASWVMTTGDEWRGTGVLGPASGGGAVSSVFGRTGAVVAASGDYEASEVTNTPAGSIAATDVQTALNELDTEKQPLDSDLTAISGNSTNGLYARTGSGTLSARTITGTSNQIAVTNGDGVSGNPTIAFPSTIVIPNGSTATTQSAGTNNTTVATTAYVDAAVTAGSIPDGDKGDITVSASGATWTIDNSAVTNSKINDVAVGKITGLGTGVPTWLATPSWTNFNSAITGTAPFWSLASGGTLTGANTITGSSSNTFKMNFPSLGTTATDGAGIFLENTTAAANGAQQISPGIILGGYGWRTNAVAESQATRFRLNVLPVQGTSTPSANFQLAYSLNGGAYSNVFTVGTGTTRMTVTGIGTTSSFTNALFNDSGGTTLLELLDDGGLRWGNSGTRISMFPSTGGTTISKTGTSFTAIGSNGNNTYNFLFVNSSTSPTNVMGFRANPANSSGTSNTYVRRSDVTINNTGTYSGVFAYDYFEPTVTSATGTDQYYAINTNVNFKTVLGATSGSSTLDVDGSFAADITATSTDITLGITHHTVVVDASGAARTITLPAAASVARRIYYIINDTGTNTVTVDPNASEVIGSAGATTYVIPAVAGNAVQIQSNGTKWLILSTI